MTEKMFKKIKSIFIFLLFFTTLFFYNGICYGQGIISPEVNKKMIEQEKAFRNTSGYETQTQAGVAAVIAMVIKGFLGLLGIIFIILLIIAGQKWMTAGGEEEKVNEAKDTIRRAIIGLIIVAAAYAITYFVFSNLPGGTTTP